jgi:hypothetical protein
MSDDGVLDVSLDQSFSLGSRRLVVEKKARLVGSCAARRRKRLGRSMLVNDHPNAVTTRSHHLDKV